MNSSKDFNIITGEVLHFQKPRQARSVMSLEKLEKVEGFGSGRDRSKKYLPPLGSPKDKKAFQYSYLDQDEVGRHGNSLHVGSKTKNVLLNYTYEQKDPITHRQVNPNCSQLTHKEFQNKIHQANMKGILTYHIDKSRLYAPNFHDNFPERVRNHEFHKRNRDCGVVADMEKGYFGKYFRKMK